MRLRYLSHVRVDLVRVDASVLLDVVEGVGHVSSAAAVVLFDAVHQVLRTEVQQLARLLGQLALEGPGRAEGPTGATGALSGEKRIRTQFLLKPVVGYAISGFIVADLLLLLLSVIFST